MNISSVSNNMKWIKSISIVGIAGTINFIIISEKLSFVLQVFYRRPLSCQSQNDKENCVNDVYVGPWFIQPPLFSIHEPSPQLLSKMKGKIISRGYVESFTDLRFLWIITNIYEWFKTKHGTLKNIVYFTPK